VTRVVLFHWNRAEAEERAERLRKAGFETSFFCEGGSPALVPIRKAPPDAFVIDLSRLPSHGREVGMALRSYKDTRRVPLVYVGGEAEKVGRIRELLPDAGFLPSWTGIGKGIRAAIEDAPDDPVKPTTVLGAYSGTPLPKKLGIKPGSAVALLGAPPGFEETLGALPEGATLHRDARGARDLAVWFVTSRASLDRDLARRKPLAKGGGLWIAWPKKASGERTDLSEPVVRSAGLAAGLVDFKICAIDSTWSGLRFSLRA
jgi:hypothetical protein